MVKKQEFVWPDIAKKIWLSKSDAQEYKDTWSYSSTAQKKIDDYKAKRDWTSSNSFLWWITDIAKNIWKWVIDTWKKIVQNEVTRIEESKKPENNIIDKTFRIDLNELKWIQEKASAYDKAYYDEKRNYLNQDFTNAKEEIARLVQYTKTDYATQLADTNKWFAKSLNKATNVYGQRWVLYSWIQNTDIWEATTDYAKQESNMAEYRDRKLKWLETQGQNIKTKFDEWMTNINRWQEADYYMKVAWMIQDKQNQWTTDLANWEKNPSAYNVNAKPTTPTWWYTMQEINDKNLITKPIF